jgi:hypothetical protein
MAGLAVAACFATVFLIPSVALDRDDDEQLKKEARKKYRNSIDSGSKQGSSCELPATPDNGEE